MLRDLPPTISTFGGDIDGVIHFIWWIILIWFVAAEGLLVYAVVRYRRREGVRAAWLPADTRRMNAWILVPTALVLVCDLFIEVRSHGVWHEVKGEVPPHQVLVRVTGRQFVWTFGYAGADGELDTGDDFQTINELRVPAHAVVRFQLESVDVLHSFFVPALRLKQDAVPGRSIPGWFQAEATGRYEIACAELCGAAHTAMRATLFVDTAADFSAWSTAHAEQQRLLAQAIEP
jgi:cytochrome c oxidase subunit 2